MSPPEGFDDIRKWLTSAKGDGGDEMQNRIKYQHRYTAWLAIQMYLNRVDFKELYCELEDDILGVLENNKFVAIQIKTRDLALGPFGFRDREMKRSILRFIKHYHDHPDWYTKFIVVSNCGFLKPNNPKSIDHLVSLVQKDDSSSFDQNIAGYICDLIEESGCRKEEVLSVLKMIECQEGPGMNEVEKTSMLDGLHHIDICKAFDPSKLKFLMDQIVLAIYYKSSNEVKNSISYYTAFLSGAETRKEFQEINGKRVTKETIQKLIENGPKPVYLKTKSNYATTLQTGSSELMKRKMELGGIDSFEVNAMETLMFAAQTYIYEESLRHGANPSAFHEEINQIVAIIVNEAAEARSDAMKSGVPFGSRMLDGIEKRLRDLLKNRSGAVFHTPYEILKGIVAMKTSDCEIAFSAAPRGGFQ